MLAIKRYKAIQCKTMKKEIKTNTIKRKTIINTKIFKEYLKLLCEAITN